MNIQEKSQQQNCFTNLKYQSMIQAIADTNDNILNSRMFQRRKPIFTSNTSSIMNRSAIATFGNEQLQKQKSVRNQINSSFSNPKSLRKKIFSSTGSPQKQQKVHSLDKPISKFNMETPKKQLNFSFANRQLQSQIKHQDQVSTQNYLHQTPKIERTYCMQQNDFNNYNKRNQNNQQIDSSSIQSDKQLDKLNDVKKRLNYENENKQQQNFSKNQLPSRATLKLLQIQQMFCRQNSDNWKKQSKSKKEQTQNTYTDSNLLKSLKQINKKNSIYEQKTIVKRQDKYSHENNDIQDNNKSTYTKNAFQQYQNLKKSHQKQNELYNSYSKNNNSPMQPIQQQFVSSDISLYKNQFNVKNHQPYLTKYYNKNSQKGNKTKNIAQELRQLHKKMSQKSKVCQQNNLKTHNLVAQNQRLLQENKQLKQKLAYQQFQQNINNHRRSTLNKMNINDAPLRMKLNVNKQDKLAYNYSDQRNLQTIPVQSNIKTYNNSRYFAQQNIGNKQDIKILQNQCISYKIKMQKVKRILNQNVLPLFQASYEDEQTNLSNSQQKKMNKNINVIRNTIQQLVQKYLAIQPTDQSLIQRTYKY